MTATQKPLVTTRASESHLPAGERGWEASSLRETVEGVVSDYRPLARHRGLHIWSDPHASVRGSLHFDSPRVRAVLRTLIATSLSSASEGWVGVRAHLEGPRHAVIEVLDTAPALSQAEFERLAREPLAEPRDPDGIGGLFTARSIARSLGGDIEHERTPTSRNLCRFRFELRPAKPVSRTSVGVRAPRGHVLLIDECPDTRQSIRRGLEQSGAIVSVAVNGRVGVDTALDGAFDLVLLDLGTPGTDGWTAMAALRQANYEIPVVALCSHAPGIERHLLFIAGFAGLIVHPVDRRALLELTARYLEPPKTQRGSGRA